MPLDEDGFVVQDGKPRLAHVRVPPPRVDMPEFFDGCRDRDEAIGRMINELGKPWAVHQQGLDAQLEVIRLALQLILAIHGGLVP